MELIQTKRHFSNICLRRDLPFHIILEFFSQADFSFLNAVTRMTIRSTTVQLLDFNQLLKMFPNLRNLELSSVQLPKTYESDRQLNVEEKPIFEHLKTLSFGHDTDNRLLQCFTNSKLTTLICRGQHFTRSTIWKFLSIQNDLKEIDFCRIASNATFELGIDPSFSFTLKRIALDYKMVSDFNGIVDFVLLQPNNFETVELGHIPVLPIYGMIFSNLKNLKSLHLMPGSVINQSNELTLQTLRSVTHLRLYDGVNYGLDPISIEEMAIKVIENLPNVEDLELFVPYQRIYYQSIITNLKKLKSLTIRVTFDTKLENLKFPSVEKLRINCFNFGKYRRRHPPISIVIAGDEDAEIHEIHETVRSLTYEGITNEEFFCFIRETFPKLERLEVRKDLAKCEHAEVLGIREVHYRESNFFTQPMRFGFHY